ncbi:hypothetical protein ENU1_007050 [Entamoeba nuttalli P19]|uniref:Uncharacterized protein n=1 Tax=Entamoeba nuttalli (strain P19) TaxID=1076696 RepID=K2HIM2_ENTNP|nr:hypothetical protein ENU1_007050 [Entamoeba nuttalli P19]EKE42874.1 hypothetical protein ENU1_007050 [Entamoeba nuttalli P19]|eukprot:XP_008854792.1 hypothetical protein ENU1_007050 [Entamoeba nuttalli P19]
MSEEQPQIMTWIRALLKDKGIEEYQDPVADMGLEFLTRLFLINNDEIIKKRILKRVGYLSELIGDIVVFSEHAQNIQPTLNDVKMAIKMRHRTTASTSKDQLRERVNACNTAKLPRNFVASVELPKPQDDNYTLLQRNYRVKTNDDFDDEDDEMDKNINTELPVLPPSM